MPTFHISVLKHQQRETDGKFPVSIRLTHNRKSAYIKTDYYVAKQQLTKSFGLKDVALQRLLLNQMDEYDRILIKEVGNMMSGYTAAELKNCIEKKRGQNAAINFIGFGRKVVGELYEAGRKKRADHIKTTMNSLEDFVQGGFLDVRELTSDFLRGYEAFLRSERTLVRVNQFGREVTTVRKPLTDTGVHDYMTDIHKVMSDVKDFYNDDDKGEVVVGHDPFKRYKQPRAAATGKRNVSLEVVRLIGGLDDGEQRRNVGRDVFLLSFLLLGINTVDLFEMEYSLADGRISYNRSKTKKRRNDNAFISLKVEPEMAGLFERYADPDRKRMFDFYKRYVNHDVFNAAVNKGLKQVAAALGVEENLTAYVARHSWATIARNRLDVGVDDIALCLNHVNEAHRVTDVYIEKDFSRIDAVNRRMLDLLFEVE